MESADEAGEPVLLVESEATRSLHSRVRRGVVWSMVGYGGGQVLRFAGNLLLTRLLFQEAFGLMFQVATFLQLLQLFSDVGIAPNIVQSARGDERKFLDTAWTLQAVRGLVLWVCACLGAYPFALYCKQPALLWILPVAGLTALVSGLWSTKLYTASRHLALGRLNTIELTCQAVALVVMGTWAWFAPSVWALVAGGIAANLLKLVLSHVALPGPTNRFHWEREAATSLFHFGKWIFVSTLLTFLAMKADALVFSRLVTIEMLGVYAVAVNLATIPQTVMGNLGISVVFPVYSRVLASGEPLAPVYRRVRWPLMLAAGWMVAGLAAGGPIAVRLFYDPRYWDAGWMVQLLALGGWFFFLEATNGAALLARGEPKWVAAANAGKVLGTLVLLPLGYALDGFYGAIAGFAGAELVKYAISAWSAARRGLKGWPQDLLLTGVIVVSVLVGRQVASMMVGHAMEIARGSYAADLLRHLFDALGRDEDPVAKCADLIEGLAVALAVSLLWLPFAWSWMRRKRSQAGAPSS